MNSFEIILYITSFNTIFMTLCFIYIYSKEKAYKSNKDLYTKIFTDIDQEIHFIKKSINEHTKEIGKKPTIDEDKIKENMKKQTISILNEVLPSVIDSIQKLDNALSDFKKSSYKQYDEIKKQTKEYTNLTSKNAVVDNRQILNLYENGKSSEEISLQLGVPKSEIDLAIKMSKHK
jgi:hypothetical protein